MRLIISTNNLDKVKEIKSIVGNDRFKLISLRDFGLDIEIPETENSLEGNALLKASKVYDIIKIPSISDDTGLFVNVLKGEPGVYSSRYAGENATYDDNCNKLLSELKDVPEELRSAYFKTVVCLYLEEDKYYFFEGIVKGIIINEKRGSHGFGYDPIFLPNGYIKTYAEMEPMIKNQISHRAIAFRKLRDFIINNLI